MHGAHRADPVGSTCGRIALSRLGRSTRPCASARQLTSTKPACSTICGWAAAATRKRAMPSATATPSLRRVSSVQPKAMRCRLSPTQRSTAARYAAKSRAPVRALLRAAPAGRPGSAGAVSKATPALARCATPRSESRGAGWLQRLSSARSWMKLSTGATARRQSASSCCGAMPMLSGSRARVNSYRDGLVTDRRASQRGLHQHFRVVGLSRSSWGSCAYVVM